MKFINNKQDMKIRVPTADGFEWKTSRKGEEIELPERIGRANRLTPVEIVTKGKSGQIEVETKQFEGLKKKRKGRKPKEN